MGAILVGKNHGKEEAAWHFQIPSVPPTTNKNIRFPNTLIAQVEEMIRGKESTFSAFVIAAVRAAVEEVQAAEAAEKGER